MSFFRYLKDNIRFVLLYFVLAAFLATIAALAGGSLMGPDGVYAAAATFAIYLVGLLVDYGIRRKQALRLRELVAADDKTPVLPEPNDIRDELYTELIAGLYDAQMKNLNRLEEDYRDSRDFMAAWAHEAKTPVTAARLILDGPVGEAEAESLREEIERINGYVEQVLYHTRADSFSRDYLLAEEELLKLVRENVKKHSALFIRKRIAVEINVPEGLLVCTDRKWLLFILDQLLSNALKYTGEQGKVTITARREGRETVLCYRDDGVGIGQADLERLFDKSFTGRNGRTEGSAATGLGLYLAQKLANKLGHRITVSSAPGQGTIAEVHFPELGESEYNLTKV